MTHALVQKFEDTGGLSAKEIGLLADAFQAKKADRLAADKVAEALKVEEEVMQRTLIAAMNAQEIKGVSTSKYLVELKQLQEPTVKDWPKLQAFILKTKDFSLLERRPSKAAIKERWDDGKTVPGVERFPVDKLYFSKAK